MPGSESESDGTAVVGVAGAVSSVERTLSPSKLKLSGSEPSRRYEARAAGRALGSAGSASGPNGRGAYAGPPITALVNTRLRHCRSVNT